MAPAPTLWLLLGVGFAMLEVNACMATSQEEELRGPSSPEEALRAYTDHCVPRDPTLTSQDTCCNRMGLNVIDGDSIQITASSSFSRRHEPHRAALFEVENSSAIAGWAAKTHNLDEWIQVDFGTPRTITGVLLQGRGGSSYAAWVSSFRVFFSNDGEIFTNTPKFEGTFDQDSVSRRMFDQPIRARYFRINPLTWHNHMTLRFDLLGCRETAGDIVNVY